MAKLTFSWPIAASEAMPSNADVKRLREETEIFQLDFLQDVISEAVKLYNETVGMMALKDMENGTSTTH